MSELHEVLSKMSDDELIETLVFRIEEYIPEARETIKAEIDRRVITQERINEVTEGIRASQVQHDRDDFVPFDQTFSFTDIALASSILREEKIPFYMDNPSSSGMLPTEGSLEARYTVHVHKDFFDAAHAAFSEHFFAADGSFTQKELPLHERLRAISFSELRMPEASPADMAPADFSAEEERHIISYAKRLLNEAEAIEKRDERFIFYYDNLEMLIDKMKQHESTTIGDLLTILEILQIYCLEENFPAALDSTIEGLLSFIDQVSAH